MQSNHFLSMFLAMTFLVINNVNARVNYDKDLNPTPPGTTTNRTNADDVHDFFVVGNDNSIEFHTIKNPQGQHSNATCAKIVPNSEGLGKHGSPLYTGPCEVNSQNQTQVLVAQCIDEHDPHNKKSGNATITWYPTDSQDDQHKAAVHVETQGNIWVGTTKDDQSKPLMQGPFTLGGLQKEAILVNCEDSKRTPIANKDNLSGGSM